MLAPLAAAVAGHLPRRALLVLLDLARAAVALVFPFATRAWEVDALITVSDYESDWSTVLAQLARTGPASSRYSGTDGA